KSVPLLLERQENRVKVDSVLSSNRIDRPKGGLFFSRTKDKPLRTRGLAKDLPVSGRLVTDASCGTRAPGHNLCLAVAGVDDEKVIGELEAWAEDRDVLFAIAIVITRCWDITRYSKLIKEKLASSCQHEVIQKAVCLTNGNKIRFSVTI